MWGSWNRTGLLLLLSRLLERGQGPCWPLPHGAWRPARIEQLDNEGVGVGLAAVDGTSQRLQVDLERAGLELEVCGDEPIPLPADVLPERFAQVMLLSDSGALPLRAYSDSGAFGTRAPADAEVARWLREELEPIKRTADLLGAPPQRVAALQPGGSCHQLAYLYSLSPRHFQAHHESELLELTPEVAAACTYKPINIERSGFGSVFRDFQDLPSLLQPGAPMLKPDPAQALHEFLPEPVRRLCEFLGHHFVLAGGAPLEATSNINELLKNAVLPAAAGKEPTSARPWALGNSDYDIFLWGLTREDATAQVQAGVAMLRGLPGCEATQAALTGHALTLSVPWRQRSAVPGFESPLPSDVVTIQIVLLLSPDPASIVSTFDITACQMLAHFDQGRWRVFATKICLVALSTRAILVDWGNWGKAAVARYTKYHLKGFHIVAAGAQEARVAGPVADSLQAVLDEEKLHPWVMASRSLQRGGPLLVEPLPGALALFQMAAFIKARRFSQPEARIAFEEFERRLASWSRAIFDSSYTGKCRSTGWLGRLLERGLLYSREWLAARGVLTLDDATADLAEQWVEEPFAGVAARPELLLPGGE